MFRSPLYVSHLSEFLFSPVPNNILDVIDEIAFIRSILGFILFSTSYCIVNTGIYYTFVRPIRREEREQLERELIEADRAGFALNNFFPYTYVLVIAINFSITDCCSFSQGFLTPSIDEATTFLQMNLPRFISTLSSRWEGIFLMGVAAGAGFELFKIYFSFRGMVCSVSVSIFVLSE
ncbi:unnamed protein product [Cylicostephanus goldi]|uniref:Uncharacterized protein n=1 Tax=Cylicostephanus goldi TaxID=71465 RepID=A0A3P6T2L5_CYLGO|nr:unnamed protein product [Cylicostephanus goldi]